MKKRFPKRRLLLSVGILILLGAGLSGYAAYARRNNNRQAAAPQQNSSDTIEKSAGLPGRVRLIATGDAIAHDSVNAWAQKPDGAYNYAALMSSLKPFFDGADVRFCNQATPAGGEPFGISGYPVFNAPLSFTDGLVSLGCNVVNIGTNHTNDKGQALIDAAVAHWDSRPGVLAVAGANRSPEEQAKVRYFSAKGLKFAFLSYTTYSNNRALTPYGVTMYRPELAAAQLTEARSRADFVIVSMRWGTEYSPEVNAQQESISQFLSDRGADIILGHGPHVLEPVRRLAGQGGRETLAWYSLGNFLNSQVETEALISGIAVMDIDIAAKKISAVKYLPIYMHYEWTAQEKQREDLAARRNPTMYPLDKAAEALSRSQLNTTVEAQTERVRSVLNRFTPIEIIKSAEY